MEEGFSRKQIIPLVVKCDDAVDWLLIPLMP